MLRKGVFNTHPEITAISTLIGTDLSGEKTRSLALPERWDILLAWAFSLLQTRLLSSQVYGTSTPFFAVRSQMEHEGLSLISSEALKTKQNANQMAVESRVVGPGCSSLIPE